MNTAEEKQLKFLAVVDPEMDPEIAGKLAERLGIEIVHERLRDELHLVLDAEGLSLVQGDLSLQADLSRMLPRLKKNNLQQEMLVKAAKIRDVSGRLTAVDATAGMGEDSLLLAAAGFSVRLYEYDPIIASLLEDALRRARQIPELAQAAERMELIPGDSIEGMRGLGYTPDVILLDPMFPARQKSGLIKKKFQLLQQLEKPCSNEEDLMQAAMEVRPHKLIIKRPLKGPYLAGKKPSYSLNGKAIRYDCLVFARNDG